ncbi:MAG: 50S ribosomal protein L3 N(5)-glutamine methyltransferase [Burkholderiales bacterium]
MATPAPATVGRLFNDIVRRLERAALHYGHGTHNARDDAAYLILHTLRLPLDDLGPYRQRIVAPGEQRRVLALVERRVREKIPVAYLTHEAWLGEYSFYVDERVIIPRSFIAELVRERFEPWLRRPVRDALDLCTGSGCLAVLLAGTFPEARVDAADLSPAALAVARRNVTRYRLGRRIRLVRSDLFSRLKDRRYDVIVCNPPYVNAASMRTLPREYRHEPAVALAGGADGLTLVRKILAAAAGHLRPGGSLVCEIGHNRRALEHAYPSVAFSWPETSAGPRHVFVLERKALVPLSSAAPASKPDRKGRKER